VLLRRVASHLLYSTAPEGGARTANFPLLRGGSCIYPDISFISTIIFYTILVEQFLGIVARFLSQPLFQSTLELYPAEHVHPFLSAGSVCGHGTHRYPFFRQLV
jgi:hypothetical protein